MVSSQLDSPNVWRYGSDRPLSDQIPLAAGPLSLVFEAGCLRRICLGEHEILRRVYVAIRDRDWDTAPDELSNVRIDAGPDSFRVRYDVANRLGDVDFAWRGEIAGEPDGTIRFSMDGEAQADFWRARIGFCVLPPMTVAGHPARVTHVDGTSEESRFPEAIAPQQVIDGVIKPVTPFEEMRSLDYEVTPGLWASVAFEGDIFEMEDQRNWTDASYKIYSTPLRLPFPVQVHRGDRVQQSITLRLEGELPQSTGAGEPAARITVGNQTAHTLPALGLGMASHGEPLSEQETERIRALNLAHLRVDLDLSSPDYAQRFARACAEAAALGAGLEIALFVDDEAAGELDTLSGMLAEQRPHISRWLVFDGDGASSPEMLSRARAALFAYDEDAPIGAGTNVYFTDLNRDRPDTSSMDVVAYSLNPQVHAFDNDSLMETPPAQAVTVESARHIAPGKPIAVSPVTLRPRFNPAAAGPEAEPQPGELPSQVDVRQMSLFAAAWTVASIKYLAESGASAVTYFETTGWRGVMETEAGSPLPEQFSSTPGGVYPMYHVFADAGDLAGGQVVAATSTQPGNVEALMLRNGDTWRMLVANLRPHVQEVELDGLPPRVAVTSLDENSYAQAVANPEAFRSQAMRIVDTSGALTWSLPAYAVMRVDFQ